MDGYDKMFSAFKQKKENNIQVAIMTSSSSCDMNGIKLDSDDLIIPDILQNGYVTNVTFPTDCERISPLKSGDVVVVAKISDDKFAILTRVVMS